MDHHDMPTTSSTTFDALALVLRLVLLLGTAFVAGAGLLRPLVGDLPRKLVRTIAALGALSAVLAIVSALTVDVNVVAVVIHVLLAIAIPVLLGRPSLVRWISAGLILLVVLETALGSSGIDFAVDTVYVAGAAVWFGVTVLSAGVPADQWRSTNFRLGPLSLTLGGMLALAGAVQLALSGVGFDRRLYETVFGVSLVLIIVLPVAATVLAGVLLGRAEPARAYRYGALGIGLGFLAWSALAAVPQPAPLPVPGVPLLAQASAGGADFPLLVSPQRPGQNLVHFPDSAGKDLSVGVAGGPVAQALARPGAEGTWAVVDLPHGRTDLVVHKGNAQTSVEVDAGDQAGPPIADADAPECASAALGGLIAERREVLTNCPSDALSTEDNAALVKLVAFVAGRKPSAITLVGDSSPRGAAAAKVVRDTAAQAGLPVRADATATSALLVVSGWAGGEVAMTRAAEAQRLAPTYQYGLYLAPWLLNGPIVNAVSSSSVPLRFDPRETLAISYAVATSDAFGGESPSVGGFYDWLGEQGRTVFGDVQIFASAQVNAMPMYPSEPHSPGIEMSPDYTGQWVPQGTIVPVSALLR
ncbi:MAG: Conserved putative rane protein [Amycolatopsis sp.]|uniref:hypothetical protein n=1 Tax=Amycolatopsis sp. TaxID=37632 RepID=UPI00260ECFBF|nr:hypothetical protein [Amycolatopsis sp.]MCU1683386.1 Conserved putative rane protein [Amycolatopsis sp.]